MNVEGLMYKSLGAYVRERRERLELTRGQVVRLAGYGNVSKAANRLHALETEGVLAPAGFLEKLAPVLRLERATVIELIEADEKAYLDAWNLWADEPIRPYLVVKVLPGVYLEEPVPDECLEQPAAEAHASPIAARRRCQVCLVFSRRLSVWFSPDGTLLTRSEAAPDRVNVPFMQLAGDRTRFVLRAGQWK